MASARLKIIVESHVPFLDALDTVADVVRLEPEKINSETVKDADALIVRTRTRCDASLLEGSRVKFVGTATIGTDHIDKQWCEKQGIRVVNAPGSNAPGVAQYVFSSLMRVINRPISSYRIGIVGVGHVGGIVERWASGLGMEVLACDPPRSERGESPRSGRWSSLDEIALGADIITFHTPLTREGRFPTYHLADSEFFERLGRAPIIVNSARGAVVDNKAWVRALDRGLCGPAIVDCWEGEPTINMELLEKAAVATPHIAGYTLDGKKTASQMVLDCLCKYFGLPELKISCEPPGGCAEYITAEQAIERYDPLADTERLRANPESFERLRNEYQLRR